VGAERLATPGTIPSTGCSPTETYEQPRGVEPASPPTRSSPRGVGLTFGAHSLRRIALFGFAIPLRPFAGPWGLPPQRRPRPIARPTRLTPRAFAPPPGFSLEVACRATPFRASRSAPLLGFPALRHMPDPRVHSRGGSMPRYVPASRFRPPRRLTPREPSRPCFMPERPWALPSRGLLLQVRRRLSRGPATLTTLAARRLRTSRRSRSHRLGARPASPSSGLPVPGVRSPQPAVRPTPLGNDPLLGFHPPWGLFRLPPRRPDQRLPPWTSRRPSDLRPAAAPALRGLHGERPSSTPRAEQPLRGSLPILKEPALSTSTPAPPADFPERPPGHRQAPSMARRLVRERVLRGPRRTISPPPDLSDISQRRTTVNGVLGKRRHVRQSRGKTSARPFAAPPAPPRHSLRILGDARPNLTPSRPADARLMELDAIVSRATLLRGMRWHHAPRGYHAAEPVAARLAAAHSRGARRRRWGLACGKRRTRTTPTRRPRPRPRVA
jgi:hypothetical protein